MKYKILFLLLIVVLMTACKNNKKDTEAMNADENVNLKDSLIYSEEIHFKTLKQITFGVDNAEASWSFGDQQLVFQSNNKKLVFSSNRNNGGGLDTNLFIAKRQD
jgi:hypothetical protein